MVQLRGEQITGHVKNYRSHSMRRNYTWPMKPLPAPNVLGKTEFERFDNAMRQVLSVSKEELLKREAKWKKARERKKRAEKSHHR